MKRIQLSTLSKHMLLLAAPILLYSCEPANAPGTRKKMPEFTSDNSLEGPMPFQSNTSAILGPEAFAFHTSNIDLEVGGTMQGFVYIPLPDASNDSAAISLLHSFKLMAMPMLNTWAKQQHQGVAIDFSNHNGAPTHRTGYVLEKTGDFSIPIVVIWDQASAYRLSELKAIASELPDVTFTAISR